MMGALGNRTVQPLSPELQTLLAYERDVVPQPEIVTARALARAREAVNEQLATTFVPRRAPTPTRRLVFAAAAGLVLMAGAAAAYQMLREPSQDSPELSPRRVILAQTAAQPEQLPPAPETPASVTPIAPLKSGSAAARGDSQEELQFLLRARQADARGDHLKMLNHLTQHRHEYPVGRLAEEREFLRVKALVALGRRGQARQVAASFRRQFPRSVLLPKVAEMLAASR